MSLGMLFDSFWKRGKRFPASRAKKAKNKEVAKTDRAPEAPIKTEMPIS